MNSIELISIYEKVDQLTVNMLTAAQSGDWDLLGQLERDCSGQVSILKNNEIQSEMPIDLKTKKISIIKNILANDKAIREITEPWMQELSNLMKNSHTTRKLSQSYGANQVG
jgi:flagellar protein FliT